MKTEIIDIPSLGKFYPQEHPASTGKVELKYPTLVEEDILMSVTLRKEGVALLRFLQALIVDKNIKVDDLLVTDVDALLIAARIMAYGEKYEMVYNGDAYEIDLTSITNKPVITDDSISNNLFSTTLPVSGYKVAYKLLSQKEKQDVENNIDILEKKKIPHNSSLERMLSYVVSINDIEDKKELRKMLGSLLMRDSIALNKEIALRTPGPDLQNIKGKSLTTGKEVTVPLIIGADFFWYNV